LAQPQRNLLFLLLAAAHRILHFHHGVHRFLLHSGFNPFPKNPVKLSAQPQQQQRRLHQTPEESSFPPARLLVLILVEKQNQK
jgi:hypothetical protein